MTHNFRNRPNEINDGVNTKFEHEPYVFELLDTAEMRRLRKILQNGFSCEAYPNMTHTRHAHSIGTAASAARMWRSMTRKNPDSGFYVPNPRDVDVFERDIVAAAVLHDVGHFALSHDLEGLLSNYLNLSHEEVAGELITGEFSLRAFLERLPDSVMSPQRRQGEIAALRDVPSIPEVLIHYKIDPQLVAQIIAESRVREDDDRVGENHFIREVVSHPLVDADKLDYLVRDRMNAGITETGFSPEGIIHDVGIIHADDGFHLAMSDKGLELITQLLTTRAYMYSRAYTQKTVIRVQAMMYEACKRIFQPLEGRIQELGRSIFLLSDEQFIDFVLANADPDDPGTRMLNIARLDRDSTYRFAYQIENRDIPTATTVNGEGNESLQALKAVLGEYQRLREEYRELPLFGKSQFPEDEMRDQILARANAGRGKDIEPHEVIVYFPYPRKLRTREQQRERFKMHIVEHREPHRSYLSSDRVGHARHFDERLEAAFSVFCRHQTSRYFAVLTPREHQARVRKATDTYIREELLPKAA